MTTAAAAAAVGHDDLPRTRREPHPPTRLLRLVRPLAARRLRRRYDVDLRGADLVPARGPVVVVANHMGWVDGPMLATLSPRPVHALTKSEMFAGPTGALLRAAGQIPVIRHQTDPRAVRIALRVLRDGGVVGVFPEGARGGGEVDRFEHGAAYLALASGAVVVPLAFLGTRAPGGEADSRPPRGARVVMEFGEPITVAGHVWPRRTAEVAELAERVHDRLRRTVRGAMDRTGIALPGPMPTGEELPGMPDEPPRRPATPNRQERPA